jgi:hypothetical protein
MDNELSKVSKRSNTPDTEEHNGLIWQTGIVFLGLLFELTIYRMEAMNRLKISVGSFVCLSTKIAATQARFYSRLLTSRITHPTEP